LTITILKAKWTIASTYTPNKKNATNPGLAPVGIFIEGNA
jgi:hypothetical protein